MNAQTPSAPITAMDANRIGEAVARVQQLQTEHSLQGKTIAELNRRLEQASDRISMLSDEARAAKRDAKIYLKHLVALASAMSNIGLLTGKAQELMLTVQETIDAETPEEAEAERNSAADIISRLPQTQV